MRRGRWGETLLSVKVRCQEQVRNKVIARTEGSTSYRRKPEFKSVSGVIDGPIQDVVRRLSANVRRVVSIENLHLYRFSKYEIPTRTNGRPKIGLRECDHRRYLENHVRLNVNSTRRGLACNNVWGEAVDADNGDEPKDKMKGRNPLTFDKLPILRRKGALVVAVVIPKSSVNWPGTQRALE